jgi:alpha-glucoside transport system substrate-binding protein
MRGNNFCKYFCVILLLSLMVFGFAAEKATAADGKVTVMAVWGGQELEVFQEMIKPFEEQTGFKVEYEGTRDLDAVLTTRVEAGNPPDIAGLPGPGKMAEFARDGKLVDLSTVLNMDSIKEEYGEGWVSLGSVRVLYSSNLG